MKRESGTKGQAKRLYFLPAAFVKSAIFALPSRISGTAHPLRRSITYLEKDSTPMKSEYGGGACSACA